MKNICRILILSLSALLAGNLVAELTEEEKQKQLEMVRERISQRVESIVSKIPDLTDEQQQELLPILIKKQYSHLTLMGKMRKMRQEGADRSEMMKVREDMDDAMNDHSEVKKVITKEQFKEYKKIMKEMAPRGPRGGGQGGGRTGGGGMRGGAGGGNGR